MALVNAATDKVPFCQEYGIPITDEEWSCYHLPYTLLADRGELLGIPIETLSKNLDVKIENTASYSITVVDRIENACDSDDIEPRLDVLCPSKTSAKLIQETKL